MTPLETILKNNPSLAARNPHLTKSVIKQVKKVETYSKYKEHINQVLTDYCKENGYSLLTEHRFHDARKFRFDWAIEEIKLAVEYEGVVSRKSRHTGIVGYSKDADKYNIAQGLGWKVYRFTALNYLEIENVLNGKD